MSDAPDSTLQTTRISPRWMIKTGIFLVVALLLTAWFALDAMVLYPGRGKMDALFREQAYLQAAQSNGALFTASVPRPKDEIDALRAKSENSLGPVERARLAWLDSLEKVVSLTSVQEQNDANPGAESLTVFPDPTQRLATLDQELATRQQPKPLTPYDIPSQYLFLVICAVVSAWIVVVLVRVMSTKFRYDASTATLTLPRGGGTISAADLELLDKRRWDKFYAYLKVRGRPGEVKLDLYRYVPLEAWVLDMWRRSPNYDGSEDASSGSPDAGGDVGDAEVMSSADLPGA